MGCNFEEFQLILKSNDNASKKDRELFKRWEDGEITLLQCFKQFMANNGYKYDYTFNDYNTPFEINITNFKRWLHSLGYVRLKKDGELK